MASRMFLVRIWPLLARDGVPAPALTVREVPAGEPAFFRDGDAALRFMLDRPGAAEGADDACIAQTGRGGATALPATAATHLPSPTEGDPR